jgi:hypothetical protein
MSMEGLSKNTHVHVPLEAHNEPIMRSVETGAPSLAVECQPTIQDHEIALAGLDQLQAVANSESQVKKVVAEIVEGGGIAPELLALALVNAANTSGDIVNGTVGAYPKHMNEWTRKKFIERFKNIGEGSNINSSQLDSARIILKHWKENVEMVQNQSKTNEVLEQE